MKLKLDFVSSTTLEDKPRDKRINFILSHVKDGTILVMDGVMHPEEEMELIKETMRRVDEGFPGIEVASLKRPSKGFGAIAEKLSDSKSGFIKSITGKMPKTTLKTGLTLIGPAKYIKKIKKNPESFSVLAGI